MQRDMWWLLAVAHRPGFDPQATTIAGNEEPADVPEAIQTTIQTLRERADEHIEQHPNQVRSKIV